MTIWSPVKPDVTLGGTRAFPRHDPPASAFIRLAQRCSARARVAGRRRGLPGRSTTRHSGRIYAGLLRQSRDADAAHDLAAETFAQAWLVRARFRDEAGGSALPWLLGIARNVLLTSVRRRRLEQRACERLGLRERLDAPPATVQPADDWLDGLDDLLADLPQGQRDALQLRLVEDRDYAGVAAALGTTDRPRACACIAHCRSCAAV